ncbi:MmgE/PrpD family protein [Pseudooceanicola marinus]|uniref:MmgE/PrpD family protein n=1 Tax=Pseudooceanicola marinus TaxID=396013 RepID=A0A1X7A5L7_9RHOB|nr:MmgE/PrpD family protein [Pseudooceanicola marinus]PJE27200.1 2-methylcitrate dehydratase [Pseudooceanicola marinus]SLN70791.1 MmgE/PrpD family protein [Pseudooceanicola marinus]
MSLTRSLAARVLAIHTLPPRAAHAARLSLLDGLATMAAAVTLEPAARPFANMARGPGAATLLAGGTAPPGLAALANGALSHALDFEDTFDATGMHPNAVALPALLALAETEGAPLTDLLTSLALACDLTCRISLSLPADPASRGWYHPPMIGCAGAALGAAHLLGLSPDQAVAAVALALVQFSLTDALKRSPASDLRAVRDGFAARAAVEGALLARAGVSGTLDPLAEAGGLGPLLAGSPPEAAAFDSLGHVFHGEEVTLKLWPCCRGTHPAVALGLALRAEGIAPETLAAAAFTLTPPDDMLFHPLADRQRPSSAIGAKFSIPYTFAHAWRQGAPGLATFAEGPRKDPETLALAAKTVMRDCAPGLTPAAHLRFTDGREEIRPLPAPPVLPAGTAQLPDLGTKLSDCRAHAPAAARPLLDALAAEALPESLAPLLAPLRS